MQLKEIKCKNCGATIEIYAAYKKATCKYCGSNYIVDLQKTINANTVECASLDENLISFITSIKEGESIPLSLNKKLIRRTGEIKKAVCFIATMSYILKRSYKIYPFRLKNDGEPFEHRYLNGNVGKLVNEFEWKRLSAFKPYDTDMILFQNIKKIDARNSDFIKKLVDELIKLGFTVEDQKKECKSELHEHTLDPFQDMKEKECYALGKCTIHELLIQCPIITPDYLEIHFKDVYDKYNQLKDRDEIEGISDELAELIINYNTKECNGIKFGYSIYSQSCSLAQCNDYNSIIGKPETLVDVIFKNYGMADIPNDLVKYAVSIAILEKLFLKTMVDESFVFDIDSGSVIPMDTINFHEENNGSTKEFILSYLVKRIKKEPVYKEW